MRAFFLVVSLLTAVLLTYSPVLAVEVDTKGLTEEQKAELALQAAKMKKQAVPALEEKFNVKNVNEWAELGKNVALAFTTVAKELGVAADEFLKSNTGKITIVLIAWKVMGKDVLGIIGGSIAWVVLASIILWSFKFFHMKKKVKSKEHGVQYIQRYEFKTNDARVTSASFHVGAFVAATIMCTVIIFG